MEKFNSLYKNLNPEQKQAVDSIDGPVMVIAGPGTGKTSVLTIRIANILRLTDTPPECVLALTFTESGADAMRSKLSEIIGSLAYRVSIYTFHGFANSLIQKHPESFPRIIGSAPASEIDQVKILEQIFSNEKFKMLRPAGDILYYVRPALNAIRHLKKEGFSPDSFKKFNKKLNQTKKPTSDEKKILRNGELAKVFKLYESKMRKAHLYDFEDMLLETIKILSKDKELLAELRENTHYILADEHQDANGAQNKILELLSDFDDKPNLFIVGDEKQAIYRFQGASLENFLYFKKKFPRAKVITLVKSYRGTQTILDASHSLIIKSSDSKNEHRPRLLSSRKETGPKIETRQFKRISEECLGIASILSKIKDKKIAVLYRDNSDAEPIARILREKGIEHSVFSDENILNDPDIENLVFLLKAVSDPTDDESLGKALLSDFLGNNIADVLRVFKLAYQKRQELFKTLKVAKETKANFDNASGLVKIAKTFEDWAGRARNSSLVDFVDNLIKESNFTNFMLTKTFPLIRLEKLHNFYEITRAFASHSPLARLSDFLAHLESAGKHKVNIGSESKFMSKKTRISLMTAHRAKGLEFDVVFVAFTTDNRWGERNSREFFHLPQSVNLSASNDLDDEKRLLYVAITRAREKVFISYSTAREDGKPLAPSRLIEDIDSSLTNQIKEEDNIKDVEEMKNREVEEIKTGRKLPKALLREIFLEEGLTVTALNNYLECPWKFFFQNLTRLPSEPTASQIYGIAVHEALKRRQMEITRSGKMSIVKLLKIFEESLKKQHLNARNYADLLEKGRISLRAFIKTRPEIYTGAKTEMRLGGVTINFDKNVINLRGVIDLFAPFANNKALVIDYKTSKPKSRNEIMGRTKTSDGNIFRQLIFYKLLVENSQGLKTSVPEGAVVFVEPDNKGICRKETFALTDDDAKELKETIIQTCREIFDFEFLDKTCDDPRCNFCRLSKTLL